ncbi:hypothetical protein Tco_1057750 [Tanacetum coccineum]|uniref:Uncharacterized protein n=1 Tax=Tanacetum coccineum TaxID=301880 RepID=A0ABQ5H8C6_9ASTR
MGLWYLKDTGMSLTAYSDADHTGCQDTRRSTLGSAQFLGDKLVRWSSKKQKSTAILSTKAECIALSGCLQLLYVATTFNTQEQSTSIIMNPVAAKQVALDNALVAPEKRLKIEKCNARIEFSKPQREETYQVTLDAFKLSTCYPAFLITAKVPEICPRLLNQDFVEPPSEDELVPFIQELGYSCKCDMLSAIHTDQMHQPWRTFAAIINRKATPKKARKFKKVASLSRKLSPVLEEEPAEKPKRAKKPADKSTTMPIAGVVIKDTPSESVSKKKTPAKVVRGKGMDLLSDVALLEAAQLKKTLKKSKLETHKLHASGSGDEVGSQPKVPDEQEDKTTSTDEGTDSGDDERNDDDGDEVTKDDDDVDSDADGDNEAKYVRTPDSVEFTDDDEEYEELYKDVNVRLQATEHEEEGKRDEEMTDAGRDEGTQQTTYEQVKDDEHVILTTVHDTQKTEVALQSSSVSSDFASQFLNLDNILPTDTKVISMMNVKVRHKEPSTQTPPILNIPVTVISETSTVAGSTIPLTIPPITPLQQQSTPTPTPALTTATTTTSVPTLPDFSSLFGFDQRVFVLEKELLQLKQADYSAQLLETIKSQIPAMVDAQLSTRLEDSIKKRRRANIDLYRFKEGDFPRLHINDIENMLLLLVHNRLKNLSGDDDFKFIIALRMFTRSLVIQKRVEDLQLGDKSYQKKINVTKPQTTIFGRNRLMRSDELYKFMDRTLTGLRTLLDDITKNIQMEYMPKRRWSTLEKKRDNIMIKAIDKQLKERRLMRSLKKFVGGRYYGTDLRLLQ